MVNHSYGQARRLIYIIARKGAGASSGGSSSGGSGSTHSGAAQLSYIGWRGAAVVAVLFGAVMI